MSKFRCTGLPVPARLRDFEQDKEEAVEKSCTVDRIPRGNVIRAATVKVGYHSIGVDGETYSITIAEIEVLF
jgi:hypothetical protein